MHPARRELFAAMLLTIFSLGRAALGAEPPGFHVPSGMPDDSIRTAAAFAHELASNVDVSFREREAGALSLSRFTTRGLRCLLRVSPRSADALGTLGLLLARSIPEVTRDEFALAHEIGHCKLREAFLQRSDGRVADPGALSILAQEVGADAYAILSIERIEGPEVPIRQAVILSRLRAAARFGDRLHSTGFYLTHALELCPVNRDEADAQACALHAAYFTTGSLAQEQSDSAPSIDTPATELRAVGEREISERLHVYDSSDEYVNQLHGADLKRFVLSEVSQSGTMHFLVAHTSQSEDSTRKLADDYGFAVGEITAQGRAVLAIRVDGDEEIAWIRNLGGTIHPDRGDGQSRSIGHEGP